LGAGGGRPVGRPNAIVGRVVDPSQRPVANVFVTALLPRPLGGHPFSFVSALLYSLTNAQGEFQLDGLAFGQMYVVAFPHNSVLNAAGQVNRAGFANTFYPNAAEFKDAKLVTVTGPDPARADITLVPSALSAVTGTVITSTGAPASGTMGIAHGDGFFGLDTRAMPLQPGGRFLLPALAPGTYYLEFHESEWPPPPGTIPNVSGAKVVLDGRDAVNVHVDPIHPVTGTGRIVVAQAAGEVLLPRMIQVSAPPVNADGNPGPTMPAIIKDDLSFTVYAWPGKVLLRAMLPSVWEVTAIRHDGADVTNQPIDFVEGQTVSGLEIDVAPVAARATR
jgi:hypothetical protein